MKDFPYEKIKAEHWEERALIADARIEALEAALRSVLEVTADGDADVAWLTTLQLLARAALAPEQDK